MTTNGLTIDYQKVSKCKAALTARVDDDVIAVETLDIGKSKSRDAFADQVCEGRPGIDRAEVDAELLKIAAELSTPTLPPSPTITDVEVDAGNIVRPERFISPEVAGLSVPVRFQRGDELATTWAVYLRWKDGRRERIDLPRFLPVSESRRLWFQPEPGEPSASLQSGWSRKGRAEWLSGADAAQVDDVFKAVCERVAYFLEFPPDHAAGITATLALWVMLGYGYHAWPAVPYLYIGGPLGSGKSRLFDVLERLAFRPLVSSNLTAPTLFRTLHSQGGTLLYDEAESLKRTSDPSTSEINSMLLAGYRRGGQATRLEPVGDSFRQVAFDVYGPKALACINGLPPALSSRCIPITMFRAGNKSDKPRRRIDADPASWAKLRDTLHAVALESGSGWLSLSERTDVCPAMSGRDFELWQPLLSLAEWVEGQGVKGLLKFMQHHALATIESSRDDAAPEIDELILFTLAAKLMAGESPRCSDLLVSLKDSYGEQFKRWSDKAVGNHLKRYGITTRKTSGRRIFDVGYLANLREIQATYGMELGFDDTPELPQQDNANVRTA